MKKSKKGFWIFICPALFAFIVVQIIPTIMGIGYSFTDWNGVGKTKNFVGLGNYITTLTNDTQFRNAFLFTFLFSICAVITVNVIGFALAMLVTQKIKGSNLLRGIFFMPNLIGGILLGFTWQFIFVQVFEAIGEKLQIGWLQGWLTNQKTGFIGLLIVVTWQLSGYMMMIYIAQIQNIPDSVLEAAQIDGAIGWNKLKSIILPLMMPAFTIGLFLSISNAFKLFDQNISLTGGGPVNSTQMLALNIYNTAFGENRFGLAQSKAVIFMIVVMVISIIQLTITKKKEEIYIDILALPKHFSFQNYLKAFEKMDFLHSLINSLVITCVATVLILLVSSMAAWVMVRYKTKVSKVLFLVFSAALLIPFQCVMLPLVDVMSKLHLMNRPGLIFMYIGFGCSMSIVLFHGFIKNIPVELEEAATIDGCNMFQTFFLIVLPLLKGIMATVAVINVMWIWNDFLLPSLIINKNGMQTLPLRTYLFFGQFTKKWDLATAALVLCMIPIVIFYLSCQKHIVKGITAGVGK